MVWFTTTRLPSLHFQNLKKTTELQQLSVFTKNGITKYKKCSILFQHHMMGGRSKDDNGQASPSRWEWCHLSFPATAPFNVTWVHVGGNWHSKLWWAFGFICLSSVPQCPAKQRHLIPQAGSKLVKSISLSLRESFQNLKSQYLKYIITLKNCHHTGSNSASEDTRAHFSFWSKLHWVGIYTK